MKNEIWRLNLENWFFDDQSFHITDEHIQLAFDNSDEIFAQMDGYKRTNKI